MRAKLISESLNFEKKSDPLVSLGVGKKALIEQWLKDSGIDNYEIDDNYEITVYDNVNIFDLTRLPDYINFKEVSGAFIYNKDKIQSKKGFPEIINDYNPNRILSLKNLPNTIGGHLDLSGVRLPNLPESLNNFNNVKLVSESLNFEKKSDPLVSLVVGKKALIIEWLNKMGVTSNYSIKDDYTIDIINSGIDLSYKNLHQFPDYIQFDRVDGYFYCNTNYLTSLRGCPKTVGDEFDCSDNNLKYLEYCPEYVGYNFYCAGNPIDFTEEYVNKICEVGGVINC
jgi:hypothetical protein